MDPKRLAKNAEEWRHKMWWQVVANSRTIEGPVEVVHVLDDFLHDAGLLVSHNA